MSKRNIFTTELISDAMYSPSLIEITRISIENIQQPKKYMKYVMSLAIKPCLQLQISAFLCYSCSQKCRAVHFHIILVIISIEFSICVLFLQ